MDDLWADTLLVLRDFGFQPDRQDRANRVIVTRPETSAQWFEAWRQDYSDAYCTLESSMHTVRRRVTVALKPGSSERQWEIDVRVDIQRADAQERQATTASAALQMFSAQTPTTGGEVLTAAYAAPRWRDLGRDPTLERRILRRLGASPAMGATAGTIGGPEGVPN